MKQQLEGGQSTASAEVESLKSHLQQMTVTMETQQQRYAHAHHGDREVHSPQATLMKKNVIHNGLSHSVKHHPLGVAWGDEAVLPDYL